MPWGCSARSDCLHWAHLRGRPSAYVTWLSSHLPVEFEFKTGCSYTALPAKLSNRGARPQCHKVRRIRNGSCNPSNNITLGHTGYVFFGPLQDAI